MNELLITKADLDAENFYKEDGIDFDGTIKIAASLGYVRFKKSIKSKLWIIAEAGSGINAGEGIEAGGGIKAGWGIITLYEGGISAKFLDCLRIAVGFNIEKKQPIKAEIRKGEVILGEPTKEKVLDEN